jgi:hypothetical protein
MLGWTTAGWAGHRHVSSHGHIWNLCTMFTAYPFAAFQKLYYLNSCSTKSAQWYVWIIRSVLSRTLSLSRPPTPRPPPPKPPQTTNSVATCTVCQFSKMNQEQHETHLHLTQH